MTIELLYTEPFSAKVLNRTVNTAADVERIADELLTRYRAEDDMLPGIELRREGGESLSIAVAPFGWALIHTDAKFDQHSTRNNDSEDSTRHEVRWEEPDSIPGNWFIPRNQAFLGISQWMTDGSLAAQLSWSNQCL